MLKAEWIRLRGRKDLWFLVIAVCALATIAYLNGADVSGGASAGGSRTALPATWLPFPDSLVGVLHQSEFLVLAVIAYLTAATLGTEFSSGTLRMSLLANGSRLQFLAVRFVALCLVTAGVVVVLALVAFLLPVLAGAAASGQVTAISGVAVGLSLVMFAWLVIAIVTTSTLILQGTGAALMVFAVYALLERTVVTARNADGSPWLEVGQYLPIADLQRVVDSVVAGAAAPSAAVPDLAATITAGVIWICFFGGAAFWLMMRADVTT